MKLKSCITVLAMIALLSPYKCGAVITGLLQPPSGSTGTVQFNQNGLFGGTTDFSYSTQTKTLSLSSVTANTVVAGKYYGDGSSLTGIVGSGGSSSGGGALRLQPAEVTISTMFLPSNDFNTRNGTGISSVTVKDASGTWTAWQNFQSTPTFMYLVQFSSTVISSSTLIMGTSDYSSGNKGIFLVADQAKDNATSASPIWRFISAADSNIGSDITQVYSSYTIQMNLLATSPSGQTMRTSRLSFINNDNLEMMSLTQNGLSIRNSGVSGADTNLFLVGPSGSSASIVQDGRMVLGSVTPVGAFTVTNGNVRNNLIFLVSSGTARLFYIDSSSMTSNVPVFITSYTVVYGSMNVMGIITTTSSVQIGGVDLTVNMSTVSAAMAARLLKSDFIINTTTAGLEDARLRVVDSSTSVQIDSISAHVGGIDPSTRVAASQFSVALSSTQDVIKSTAANLADNTHTINAPDNPVSWNALKDVPAGFADGTDDGGAGSGPISASDWNIYVGSANAEIDRQRTVDSTTSATIQAGYDSSLSSRSAYLTNFSTITDQFNNDQSSMVAIRQSTSTFEGKYNIRVASNDAAILANSPDGFGVGFATQALNLKSISLSSGVATSSFTAYGGFTSTGGMIVDSSTQNFAYVNRYLAIGTNTMVNAGCVLCITTQAAPSNGLIVITTGSPGAQGEVFRLNSSSAVLPAGSTVYMGALVTNSTGISTLNQGILINTTNDAKFTGDFKILSGQAPGAGGAAQQTSLYVNSASGTVSVGTNTSKAVLTVWSDDKQRYLLWAGTQVAPTSSLAAPTSGYMVAVSSTGHFTVGLGSPTISSCGSTPNGALIGGTDQAGTIQVGGGATTACTVTFAVPWRGGPGNPSCIATGNSTTVNASINSQTNTGFVLGFSGTFNGTAGYICIGVRE